MASLVVDGVPGALVDQLAQPGVVSLRPGVLELVPVWSEVLQPQMVRHGLPAGVRYLVVAAEVQEPHIAQPREAPLQDPVRHVAVPQTGTRYVTAAV